MNARPLAIHPTRLCEVSDLVLESMDQNGGMIDYEWLTAQPDRIRPSHDELKSAIAFLVRCGVVSRIKD